MKYFYQVVLIVSTLIGSWLGMLAVHEAGHALAGWATGGRVVKVALRPLAISRTDVDPNPQPLVVVWAGPLIGALAPLLCWLVVAAFRDSGAFVIRFFAGFALVANGLYIGIGSFGRIGDSGVMLQHGSAMWQLWLFGALAAPTGFWLWHGQGKYFGLGTDAKPVNPGVAFATLALCATLLTFEFALA